jgi:hypothetical protein
MASRYQFRLASLLFIAASTGASYFLDGPHLAISLGGAAMGIVALWWRRTGGILHPQVLRFRRLGDRRALLYYDPDLFGQTDLTLILKSCQTGLDDLAIRFGFVLRGPVRIFCVEHAQATYLLAGSFTGFLIGQFGWERYLRFYKLANMRLVNAGRFGSTFEKCFGVPLKKAESQWHVQTLVLPILRRQLERTLRS